MSQDRRTHCLLRVLAVLMGLTLSGCVGLASHLLYAVRGNKAAIKCHALEGKKVAVVCVSKASTYGAGTEGSLLARHVESILKKEIKNIKMISHSDIENWIDNNGWNELDYRLVGKGVRAEMVVAIDVESFSLYEGSTLFKGRSQITTSVFDMTKGGELAFRDHPPEFTFPSGGGFHSTDTTEANFRRTFLQYLSRQVCKPFYAYDLDDDYMSDVILWGEK